jgi:hypothetical protein
VTADAADQHALGLAGLQQPKPGGDPLARAAGQGDDAIGGGRIGGGGQSVDAGGEGQQA